LEVNQANVTQQWFYLNSISKNLPVHVIDGAKQWPALEKWNDIEYLIKAIKNT
jgi:hypothetical protein